MAILIDQIVGHDQHKQHLIDRLQRGELPSTCLFTGPSGVGKAALAKALLQIANCSQQSLACGTCSNCLRVEDEQNEMIVSMGLTDKKVISVDQVRELRQGLSLKPLSPYRFVIIDPADKLSSSAANALLKLLEEPPPSTHFFLITNRLFALLPTIRSRAHIYRFGKLSHADLRAAGGFDDFAIEWSDGRFEMASLMSEKDSVDLLNRSLKFLYGLISESPQDWKKHSPWFFNSDEERLMALQLWDQAIHKKMCGQGSHLDWLPEGSQWLGQLYDSTQGLARDLNANMDKMLAVESFYYSVQDCRS